MISDLSKNSGNRKKRDEVRLKVACREAVAVRKAYLEIGLHLTSGTYCALLFRTQTWNIDKAHDLASKK